MAKSRYEKYVVRKPARLIRGKYVVPDVIKPTEGLVDSGPAMWSSDYFIKSCKICVESGIISGDCIEGTGRNPRSTAHKHDWDEIFMFLGTNPNDIRDLGAEVEFWLGEGEELDKVVLNTTGSVLVPAGLAHFPIIWRNVKRPCIMVVVLMATLAERESKPPVDASLEGRPSVSEWGKWGGKTWANI